MYQIPELFKSPNIWVEGGKYIPGSFLEGATVYYEELPIVLNSESVRFTVRECHFMQRAVFPCLENK